MNDPIINGSLMTGVMITKQLAFVGRERIPGAKLSTDHVSLHFIFRLTLVRSTIIVPVL